MLYMIPTALGQPAEPFSRGRCHLPVISRFAQEKETLTRDGAIARARESNLNLKAQLQEDDTQLRGIIEQDIKSFFDTS
jgi:hypothetical protein